MIYVTGDLHGFTTLEEKNRLSRRNFDIYPLLRSLTKEDYLIVCGDFGLFWDNSSEERYWRDWLSKKPYTTLFLDGNHENFEMLGTFPVSEWMGGQVQEVGGGMRHLLRGQVYMIDGKRIFIMGGAESHDKELREEGTSWWPQEMPTEAEFDEARRNLDACGWRVNYVLTHSLPTPVQAQIFQQDPDAYPGNALTDFLEEIRQKLTFRAWYSGHYHLDGRVISDPRLHLIYNGIRELK